MSMTLTLNNRQTLKRVLPIVALGVAMLLVAGFVYLSAVRSVEAARPADFGLREGDTVSAAGSDDPDVYIVNEMGYKRLFLNPAIFGFYGHLGGFANVKSISPATRDAFPTSGLFRNCETGDQKVYGVETTGEDVGMLHWVNTSGAQAVADDPMFFNKVFCINNNEFSWYSQGSNYSSVNQVPSYARVPGATPVPSSGPLSVWLASGNPAAKTITKNAVGVEFLRIQVNGSGTVNTLTVKRLGAGETDDFNNVYVYDGAKRLTSGKSFSSSSGEATFLLNVAVSGSKELSIVADMASANTAGNVNYVQLVNLTATGQASASGTPLNGNNFASSGASSGTLDTAKVGSLSNPTVGQKNAQLSEFKLTANTEGASIKRLTMLNGGTIKPADLTNVKLKTGSMEWSGTSTADSYLVFDLGSGYSIAKGGNATFMVYGDLNGKKDETVILYFENDSDILSVGDQYGQGMAEGTNTLDLSSEATTLTLQGGALTLAFNGPSATTVGTTVTDVTLLRYSMTVVSNIEVKKTEFTLCADTAGDGTFDDASDETEWDDLTDFKVTNETTSQVVLGPKDGTAFNDANDTGSCPNSQSGAQEIFTDTLDLAAGKTYNFKVTADINTANGGTLTAANSVIRAVLDDYSDDAGDVTVMKYSGTNTSVAAADIVPRADIAGPNITLSSAALTLSLAGAPSSQTKIRGTQDVNAVGITFAAGQASALNVRTIKLTGYAIDTSGDTYDEGTPSNTNDSGISVANMASTVELYDSTGALVAGADKVTNNSLGTGGTGTMTFGNLNWNLPAGTSKTLLVRVDLSNNTASGTAGDLYAFDIAATTDVTSLDSDSNTVNAGNAGPNGGLTPTKVLTVKNGGSMTLAAAAGGPPKGAIFWGQQSAPVSKFRISATDEGQYIEKLTFAASVAAEATDAAANVKEVVLTYKNKAGSTLTKTQSFGNAASVNFNWAGDDADRPYVPQDSSLDLSVNANMKTKAEGATEDSNSAVFFSLDLVDKFNGSVANGFRAVGDGSGTVIDGSGTNIADVLGQFDQYVYRVFPKIQQVDLAAPYSLLGTPTVFKFSITAMGLSDANLRFDNQHIASGSIYFEVVSSGQVGNTSTGTSTTFSILDESGVVIDGPSALRHSGEHGVANLSQTNATNDADPAIKSSIAFDFTNQVIEITGGQSRTFSIRINNPNTNYSKASSTGRAADYFQVTLQDDPKVINWVGNYGGNTNALDSPFSGTTAGILKSIPLYGPTFQR